MAYNNEQTVQIFTDGACSGNPGPGGYGALLKYGDRIKELSGYEADTTNNRMEMTAVIKALMQLKKPCRIKVVTDSSYVVKGMTQWVPVWLKRNWLNSQNKPVLNRDLWEKLIELSKRHQIEWIWIKGHNGHPENERCDELARSALKNCQ
ncbi:MAG: ribonuclease HI [Deltaproteobacteria bacterium]|nr:ribonuclease HI [Deltaproteobacteria bacterium]